MDGVSAAASVVALLEVSLKVVSLCKEYYSKVKDAKDDINRFRLEFQTFVHILRGLRRLAEDSKTAHIFASQSLAGSITQCQSDLEILQQKLDPGKHQKTMSRFGMRALRWPFQSSDVEKIMQSLERYKSTFNATLNIDQTYAACSSLFDSANRMATEFCYGTSTQNSIEPSRTVVSPNSRTPKALISIRSSDSMNLTAFMEHVLIFCVRSWNGPTILIRNLSFGCVAWLARVNRPLREQLRTLWLKRNGSQRISSFPEVGAISVMRGSCLLPLRDRWQHSPQI